MRRLHQQARTTKRNAGTPQHYPPHESIPEQIDRLERKKRRKYLILHPTTQSDSFPRPEVSRFHRHILIVLHPDGPEYPQVLIVSEVCPYTEKECKGNFRCSLQLKVIEHFRQREKDICNVHAEEDSYADIWTLMSGQCDRKPWITYKSDSESSSIPRATR